MNPFNFFDREPIQRWLSSAIQKADSDEFRFQVVCRARDFGATGTDAELERRLLGWKTDIKSGGRPIGLYLPKLVLERELRSAAPDLTIYRDDQHPTAKNSSEEADHVLLNNPQLVGEWIALTKAFRHSFADHILNLYKATRIQLFRGMRIELPDIAARWTPEERMRWARQELVHGVVENWTPLPWVAEGALNDQQGIIIGAEFDTHAVVCAHQIGAETNVTPWLIDGGRVIPTFRYICVYIFT